MLTPLSSLFQRYRGVKCPRCSEPIQELFKKSKTALRMILALIIHY